MSGEKAPAEKRVDEEPECSYPFMPVRTMPWTKYFWAMQNEKVKTCQDTQNIHTYTLSYTNRWNRRKVRAFG